MNNSIHFNTTDNSANALAKNLHELSYLQRLSKIERRENKYFNKEFDELKTPIRNRNRNSMNCNNLNFLNCNYYYL
jgi:hypothetical protein